MKKEIIAYQQIEEWIKNIESEIKNKSITENKESNNVSSCPFTQIKHLKTVFSHENFVSAEYHFHTTLDSKSVRSIIEKTSEKYKENSRYFFIYDSFRRILLLFMYIYDKR